MAGFEYSDNELIFDLNALTGEEAAILTRYVNRSEIRLMIDEMKEAIAQEAKNRIQSKISLTLNHGYGTGALFNSIYYKIEGEQITISSTKNYFAILNHGFGAFDMKEALAGRRVKMRLPGGAIIYRTVGPQEQKVLRPGEKPNKVYSGHNWIHPGFHGVHIYERVAEEMKLWVQEYVRGRIRALVDMAKGRAQDALGPGKTIFATNALGRTYYNVRNAQGQFAKAPSTMRNLIKDDLLRFKYQKHGPTGAYSPLFGRSQNIPNRTSKRPLGR